MSELDLDMVIFENNAEATQDMMNELADLRRELVASQARARELIQVLADWYEFHDAAVLVNEMEKILGSPHDPKPRPTAALDAALAIARDEGSDAETDKMECGHPKACLQYFESELATQEACGWCAALAQAQHKERERCAAECNKKAVSSDRAALRHLERFCGDAAELTASNFRYDARIWRDAADAIRALPLDAAAEGERV